MSRPCFMSGYKALVGVVGRFERSCEIGGAFDYGLGGAARGLDRFEHLAVEREHAQLDRHEAEINACRDNDALRFTGN